MNSFNIHILSADRLFYEGPCESVIVPSIDGQYGVQAGHNNVITAIVPGKLTYRVPGGSEQVAAISSGVLKVEGDDVLIITESALLPEEIDEARARRSAEDAREAMSQHQSRQQYYSAQAQLARAISKLRLKSAYIKGGTGRH